MLVAALALLAAVVAALTTLAPGLGLGVALVVAAASSLPWQLGGPNLALPLWSSCGVLVGLAMWRWRQVERSPVGPRDVLLVVSLAVPTTLALVRLYGSSQLSAPLRTGSQTLAELTIFNPPGLAGTIASALIWIVGPATYLLLAGPLARRDQQRLLSVGAALAVCLLVGAPAIQYALGLETAVRPDLDIAYDPGTGLLGFSQDPHGHAALLSCAVCVLVGLALSAAARRKVGTAVATLGIAAIAAAELLLTGSIGGAIACAAGMLMLGWLAGRRLPPGTSKRAFLLTSGGAAVLVAGLAALAFSLLPGESVLQEHLSERGLRRISRIFDPQKTPWDLARGRSELARKAVMLSGQNALWGVGPGQFSSPLYEEVNAESLGAVQLVENVHSVFLQLSAELGAIALVLWAWIVTVTLRGGVRASGCGTTGYVTAGLVGGLVSLVVVSLGSNILLLAEGQLLFWTLVAWITAEARRPSRSPRPQ